MTTEVKSIQSAADYTCIAYEVHGAVARIDHNRTEARNAESSTLLDEMDAALDRAVADPAVRVIIFGARGPHFSAGHDLKEATMTRSNFTPEQRFAYEEKRYFGYAKKIWDAPKPTIAQVQGACVAGGFMVANMCDLVVAADDAMFSDPVCRSLAAASVEVLVHPWVMGLRKAKEFLFTGERMPAAEAHRIGMVNRVVPRANLEAETMALAQKIAEGYPFALKLTKKSLNRTFDMQGFSTALDAHFDTHQLAHTTSEAVSIRSGGLDKAIVHGSK